MISFPRFVLSAGHCFCANEYDPKLGRPGVITCTNDTLGRVKELRGEEADRIRVFLGSLSVDVREVSDLFCNVQFRLNLPTNLLLQK